MRRLLAVASLCLVSAGLCGCTLCASPYDNDYGFYGGSWERSDPSNGRVGSRFNNAGGPVNPTDEEAIQTPGEPTPTEIPSPLQPNVEGEVRSSPPRGTQPAAVRTKPKRTNSAWTGGLTGGRLVSDQK